MIISSFLGEMPGQGDLGKPVNAANIASNLLLDEGLVPKSFVVTQVSSVATTDQSVVRIDGQTYTLPAGFVARSPLADDANGRIYYTYDAPVNGQTAYVVYSKGTDGRLLGANAVVRKLGVPLPTAPSITTTNTTISPPAGEVPVATYYAITLTNQWGEEGPLSNPSAQATLYSNTTVVIARPAEALGSDIAKWNIYMANDGQWQFLQEVDKATPNITLIGDAAKYPALGEVCPSLDWLPPPTDIKGLVSMSGGFMAAYSGRRLVCSEAYLPHAWPSAYSYPVQYDILGIVPVSGGAIVVTNGRQYAALGASPSTLQLQQLEMDAGCVSRDSIIDMGEYAVYASTIGLIKMSLQGVELISQAAFTRHAWLSSNPSSIKAMRIKHYYVFQSSNSPVYVLDTNTGIFTRTDKLNLTQFYRGFYDPTNDLTYAIKLGGTPTLNTIAIDFTTGSVWESRALPNNAGIAPSWGQIDSDSYPITLEFGTSATGTAFTYQTYIVNNRKPFRLAAGREIFAKFRLSNFAGQIYRVVLTNDRGEFV
jgi:hypothetical protein